MSASCRRLVLMRITGGADDVEAIRRLHGSFVRIPGVTLADAAQAITVRAGDLDFTHVSLFEFADENARREYEVHPDHVGAGHEIRSRLDRIAVLDVI
jgi:hypothetical protein